MASRAAAATSSSAASSNTPAPWAFAPRFVPGAPATRRSSPTPTTIPPARRAMASPTTSWARAARPPTPAPRASWRRSLPSRSRASTLRPSARCSSTPTVRLSCPTRPGPMRPEPSPSAISRAATASAPMTRPPSGPMCASTPPWRTSTTTSPTISRDRWRAGSPAASRSTRWPTAPSAPPTCRSATRPFYSS